MFNTLLSDNVLRIIRIKCVIRIIRNTRIKQLRIILYNFQRFALFEDNKIDINDEHSIQFM